MSIAKNRIVRSVNPTAIFEEIGLGNGLSTSSTFNQGDLLVLDATTHTLRIATTESTDSANFAGISRATVINGVPVGPYQSLATSTREVASAVPGPQLGVEVSLVLKSADVAPFGTPVFLDITDGAQFCTITGTNSIGRTVSASTTGDGVKTVIVKLSSGLR